jgi:hypothetical protein
MQSVPVLRSVVVAASFLAALCIPAVAHTYQPLTIGAQWVYVNQVHGPQTMTITGERVVLGALTRIRHQSEAAQTYENYWTADADGNLWLHGAYNYDGFNIAYLPPIQMASAPLFEGKTWVTQGILLYGLDGTPSGETPFDYPLRVYTEGVLTVPAGDFYAYGVGYDTGSRLIFTREGKSYDMFGRALDADPVRVDDNSTEWYSDGVGLVMFGYADRFLLESYGFPVPVEHRSWGGIRALYR